MPRIAFTANLRRHLDCPPTTVPGRTVREALEGVFSENRSLRGYVLDDQGRLRRHVAVFVNGDAIVDKADLTDEVDETDEIYVMQALSGG